MATDCLLVNQSQIFGFDEKTRLDMDPIGRHESCLFQIDNNQKLLQGRGNPDQRSDVRRRRRRERMSSKMYMSHRFEKCSM